VRNAVVEKGRVEKGWSMKAMAAIADPASNAAGHLLVPDDAAAKAPERPNLPDTAGATPPEPPPQAPIEDSIEPTVYRFILRHSFKQ
jgi:hypothetical protein